MDNYSELLRRQMEVGSVEESKLSNSEIEDQIQKIYLELKDEGMFKTNEDGTFRCPFCLGKKRQSYKYQDILQHANGIANSAKKLIDSIKHRALERFLRYGLDQPEASSPPPKRIKLECREDPFVWPWMAIVMNVPAVTQDGTCVTNEKLKAQFARFSPLKATLMWDWRGFRETAIVEFNKDWSGFYGALSFEKSFELNQHGKVQWFESKGHESGMYAWLAREDDYYTSDNYIREQLHCGELITIYELENEEQTGGKTPVDDQTCTTDGKIKDLQPSAEQLMEMAVSLNQYKSELEKKATQMAQLVEAVKKAGSKNITVRSEILKERKKWRRKLANEMSKLAQQRIVLQEREAQNDYERKKLEEEKKKNASRDVAIHMATIEQKKAEESFLKLMEDRKREKDVELKNLCDMEKRLQTKQTLELEIEKLRGNLKVMKAMEVDDIDKIMEIMREDLEGKQSELDHLESNYQALIVQQRMANDELQEARKEAILGFKSLFANQTEIGIKRMGELNPKPFEETYMRLFSTKNVCARESELKATELVSKWEDYMKDPNWFPFKVIEEGCNAKEVLDENDVRLRDLRYEWGNGIYESVVTAMKELNEYNPSGRYTVEEIWNFDANRKASLREVIAYLVNSFKAHKRVRGT